MRHSNLIGIAVLLLACVQCVLIAVVAAAWLPRDYSAVVPVTTVTKMISFIGRIFR